MKYLILYTKPGCHLCEGLQEKLEQLSDLPFQMEVRDITHNPDWFNRYQYEVPVLCQAHAGDEQPLPRPSPRASLSQLAQMLQKHIGPFKAE
jgi:hypothetical protein